MSFRWLFSGTGECTSKECVVTGELRMKPVLVSTKTSAMVNLERGCKKEKQVLRRMKEGPKGCYSNVDR